MAHRCTQIPIYKLYIPTCARLRTHSHIHTLHDTHIHVHIHIQTHRCAYTHYYTHQHTSAHRAAAQQREAVQPRCPAAAAQRIVRSTQNSTANKQHSSRASVYTPNGDRRIGSEPLLPLGLSSLGYASYIEQPTRLLAHGPAPQPPSPQPPSPKP